MATYTDSNSIGADGIVTDAEAIDNSIKTILLTRVGSVPGKPLFGSELYFVVFNQMDHITITLIKDAIHSALNNFEPRISILNVTIKEQPEYNRVIANIKYKYYNKNGASETTTSVNITNT